MKTNRLYIVLIVMAGIVAGCASPTAQPTLVEPAATAPIVVEPTATAPTLSATPVVTEGPAGELPVNIVKGVPYIGDRAVDVYYPSELGHWPVFIVLHGAGGDKSLYAPAGEGLAPRGAVVFVADWRSEPWVSGEMAMMEDTACIVRFARSTAAEYGGDASRVVLFGHSIAGWSGATIALAGDEFAGDCAIEDVSAVPDAFVSLGGAYDAGESNSDGGASYLKEEDPEMWDLIYPYAHIGNNLDTSFRLIAGDQDQHDVDVAQRFFDALQKAGYEAELVIIEGVGHDGGAGTPKFEQLLDEIFEAASD